MSCLLQQTKETSPSCANQSAADRETPYLMILGCGFSGTGAIARFLAARLAVVVSHEDTDIGALATSGVSAWPATMRPGDVTRLVARLAALADGFYDNADTNMVDAAACADAPAGAHWGGFFGPYQLVDF